MNDILIVDDERDIRELVSDILEDEGYASLTALPRDTALAFICHTGARSAQVAEEFMPIIHLVFPNLKTWLLGIHHGVSPQHLQAYLNEFTFRFNRRTSGSRGMLFYRLLPTVLGGRKLNYQGRNSLQIFPSAAHFSRRGAGQQAALFFFPG